MHILLIGSGGREHALAWKIKQSKQVSELYSCPGNAGIYRIAPGVSVDIKNHAAVVEFCKQKQIGLVVVGPEAPLVDGLADSLEAAGIPVFGCSRKGAQLEGSKKFTKELCDKYNIPTAAYGSFVALEPAKQWIKTYVAKNPGAPIVVKADGLAAGKGVVITTDEKEAVETVASMFAGQFGAAGKTVVLEEFMEGEEASVFALCDGKKAILIGSAQDHKRIGDGDTGPNTGGMGTYSPAPVMNKAMEARVMREIIEPSMAGLKQDGIAYKGVLFAGIMVTKNGPKLLEYNARFGDPETQVLMLRIENDLVDLLLAAAKGDLGDRTVQLSQKTALCVVMATKGYPGEFPKNTVIQGIEAAETMPEVQVFHAGTVYEQGQWKSNGGRVLGVTASGNSVAEAQKRAYEAVKKIQWPEGYYRKDIGWRAMQC